MLSIVKMDLDSDVEVLDDGIKTEVIDVDENSNEDKTYSNLLNNVVNDLELIPIVYTTKLDDMSVGRILYPVGLDPKEATARMIKESKPMLCTYPGPPKRSRKSRRKYRDLEETLRRIYQSPKVLVKEEIDVEPDTCDIQIDFNSVKSEVIDEPIVNVKTKVLEEQVVEKANLKDTCKYSELLKQCKPCKVLLSALIGHGQVLHGGQLLQASRARKPSLVSSSRSHSSDDEVPLITFPPDLLVERVSSSSKLKQGRISTKADEAVRVQPKILEINTFDRSKNKALGTTELPQRLLRNGLLEIEDTFSNDHYFYFTDYESNLLDYFKNLRDKSLFETTHLHECRYKINNCCWFRKDEFIQSLYPKVLLFSNSRFMRYTHPCKPHACTCCCRKKESFKKPDLDFTGEQPVTTTKQNSSEGDVIRDLEEQIDISIININKTPKLNSKEWLRDLLTAKRDAIKYPNSLIGKALNYNKPAPAKMADNRRLVTLKKDDLLKNVIVFRYFAEDLIEIFEINAEGDVETYLKTACYSNTSRPDVKSLLRKRYVTSEAVCCWYKREEVISKLQKSKVLHPDAVKFVRTAHAKMPCQNKECQCCCRPKVKAEIILNNITLPTRSLVTSSTLNIWRPAHVPQKDDDDCQITSVMNSPSMQPVKLNPTIPATAVPPSLFVTDAVDNDELSNEVNTLITSILDRFKDVRLTINSDGKVAAALNTPVNTLSTVELKVLANILSFAQSQVNLLGSRVSSGASLSLSNIINLKVDDVHSNTTIDPNTVYKEFAKNVNINTVQKQFVQPINVNMNAPLVFPHVSTMQQPYNLFTDSMSVKNQQFNDAFSSFINSKIDGNAETVTPVIENVYSLKENENTNEDATSTTVWYRKPTVQSSSNTSNSSNPKLTRPNILCKTKKSQKRNDASKPDTAQPKRLRIRSPTNLGAVIDNPTSVMINANIPQQQFQMQQTPPVGGLMPGLYVLPNNNFIVPSLGQQQMVNCMPAPPVQQPMLIINPLHNTGGTLIPINTPNGLQSNVPVILNADSTSQLVNTDSGNYITVEKEISPQEATSEEAGVTEVLNPLNDQEMDSAAETVCFLEDEGQITGNDGDMDSDEEIELKYSPETNEAEEEDCILGF